MVRVAVWHGVLGSFARTSSTFEDFIRLLCTFCVLYARCTNLLQRASCARTSARLNISSDYFVHFVHCMMPFKGCMAIGAVSHEPREVGGWGRDSFPKNVRLFYRSLLTRSFRTDEPHVTITTEFPRGGGLGSRPIFKKFHETDAPS